MNSLKLNWHVYEEFNKLCPELFSVEFTIFYIKSWSGVGAVAMIP